jgi:ABC-type polysaccharide/polyol phosphate export permease
VALPLFLLAAGIGLLFSMASIVAVDVRRVADKGLELVMYLVPVIYAGDVPHPFIQAVIPWNPLTYLVCSARDIVIWGRLYDGQFGAAGYAVASGLALVVFLFSWRLFFLGEARIVERML